MIDFSLTLRALTYSVANVRSAAWLSLPFYVVWVVQQFLMTVQTVGLNASLYDGRAFGALPMPSLIMVTLPLAFVAFILSLITFVGWHRLVLLDERPRALVALPTRRVWRYFLAGFKVALVLLVVLIPIGALALLFLRIGGAIASETIGARGLVTWLFFLAVSCIAVFVALRLNLVLPAAAVDDRSMDLRLAWRRSEPYSKALAGLAVAFVGSSAVVDWLGTFLVSALPFGLYANVLLSYLLTMAGSLFVFFVAIVAISLVYHEVTKPLDKAAPGS